jgi:hypothetical protein
MKRVFIFWALWTVGAFVLPIYVMIPIGVVGLFWSGWVLIDVVTTWDARRSSPLNAHLLRECPFCKRTMRKDASVCPSCQRESPAEPLPG